MKTTMTADEIAQYRADGYLAVEDVFTPDELQEWRETFDRAVKSRLEGMVEPELTPEQAKARRAYGRVFTQLQQLWKTDDGVRSLLFDSSIGRLCGELAGVDGLRVWHDQALIKPAFGSPTDFHMDVPYWSFTSNRAISIWIPLDDATVENGCLFYVPRSHLAEQTTYVALTEGIGAIFESNDAWGVPEPVAAPVRAGGAIFHNGLVVHGAAANMTPRARRAMTCAFMPEGARFNGRGHNVLGRSWAETLEVGDVLDNDERLPPIWRAEAQ